MPPKQDKSKGPPPEAEIERVTEEVMKWSLREAALKSALAKRMSEVAKSRLEEAELRENLRLLTEAFAECRGERFDIVSDFTRQHKATEDELIARCTILENTITDLKDQQELSRLALTETCKERDQFIAMKQREYDEQERRIKEMDEEFRQMLAETQHRMTERVNAAVKAQAEDVSGDDANDE